MPVVMLEDIEPQGSNHGRYVFQEMTDEELEGITEKLIGIDDDEEEIPEARRWSGSVLGKSSNVHPNREEAAYRLHLDYFSERPVYSSQHFKTVSRLY